MLPCPSGTQADYADGEMLGSGQGRRNRRQRACAQGNEDLEDRFIAGSESTGSADGVTRRRRRKRECPVPKPGGLVGEILGFKSRNRDTKASIQSEESSATSEADSREDKDVNGWRGKRVVFTVPVQQSGPYR
jgi:cytochrome c oxidase assembly factor 2